MKLCKITICLTFILLLSGCYDMLEPNEYAYVTAIGIDTGENNNYNFTIQFAKPAQISGGSGEEGGKGGDIVENISVESPNLFSAVGLVNDIMSKNLSLSHMKLLVFSEDIAKSGINNFLDTLVRSDDIKPSIYMAVSFGEAKNYLEEIKPIVEINPAKYYQMIFDKEDFGAVPRSNGLEIYFDIKTEGKNAVIALAGTVEEKNQANIPPTLNSYEYGIKDYKAGEMGVFKEKKSEAVGSGIFKNDKMTGTIGVIETNLYNLLTDEFVSDYMSIKTSKSDYPITINVTKTDNTTINYNKKEHCSEINIELEGEFMSLPEDYITENDISSFENEFKNAITDSIKSFLIKTQTEFDSDIIGFGNNAKRKFLTYKEFESFGWDDNYKNLSFNVNVEFQIRRTGLTKRREP